MVLTTLDTLLTKNQFHFSLDFGSLIASWESRQGLFFKVKLRETETLAWRNTFLFLELKSLN